jgi:hypothetical protein
MLLNISSICLIGFGELITRGRSGMVGLVWDYRLLKALPKHMAAKLV